MHDAHQIKMFIFNECNESNAKNRCPKMQAFRNTFSKDRGWINGAKNVPKPGVVFTVKSGQIVGEYSILSGGVQLL